MSQFRTKAEAQQAIEDMERRAAGAWHTATSPSADAETRVAQTKRGRQYDAEAARIRALLPTLPE